MAAFLVGSATAGLALEYGNTEWIFLGSEPLRVLADGTVIEFPAVPQAIDRRVQDGVLERVGYLATAEQMRQVARADSTIARIKGSNGSCDFVIYPGHRTMFGMFADSVLAHP